MDTMPPRLVTVFSYRKVFVTDIVLLVVSLLVILLCSELFTNGIEHLGVRLNMHQGAVGSILAAVGTALPETVIPIIAIFVFRDAEAKQVAVGAIAGAPFMLGTLAFFVTGVAVLVYSALGRRSRKMVVDDSVIVRDLSFFVVLYGIAVLTTFMHEVLWLKTAVAVALLLSYIYYIIRTLGAKSFEMEEPDRLYLGRILRVRENLFWIALQVAGAVALMVYGAHMFVKSVEVVAATYGIAPLVLSILITPVATELPEKFNSVIWIGRKKDVLALGNITGAMVFQSSFPVAFGVAFTDWDLHGTTMLSAILAFSSALLVLAWAKFRKTMNPYLLMAGGVFYATFLLYIFI